MTTQIDWQHELDSSFGHGEDAPALHYLGAGRRAVRRRRAAAVVAGLVAVVAVAGGAWTAVQVAPSSGEAHTAGDPRGRSDGGAADAWRDEELPVRSGPAGLVFRPGTVVHEQVDDIYPPGATDSAAVDLTFDGARWWIALEWDDGGGGTTAVHPDDGTYDSFDAFVQGTVERGHILFVPGAPADSASGTTR